MLWQFGLLTARKVSPSSRRAWIEITVPAHVSPVSVVALLAEGVDRNIELDEDEDKNQYVALLAEGVDRNFGTGIKPKQAEDVALLAEGVDRNYNGTTSQ